MRLASISTPLIVYMASHQCKDRAVNGMHLVCEVHHAGVMPETYLALRDKCQLKNSLCSGIPSYLPMCFRFRFRSGFSLAPWEP